MTTSRLPARRRAGRRLSSSLALVLLLAGATTACDVTVDVPLTCSIVGPLFSQRIRSAITPDNVAPGGTVQMELSVGWIQGRSQGTVTRVELTLPLPVDVATVDAVAFDGADLTGSWAVAGRHLVLTFTGAASEQTVQIPKVKLTATIAGDARLGELPWRTVAATTYWSEHVDGTFQARCVPTDPGTIINNSYVTT